MNHRHNARSGPESGFTLLEMAIVAIITSAIVLLASNASSSISGIASHGIRKLQVESDCQELLHYLANDLQNSSSDSDPITLLPRYEIEEATAVAELLPITALTASQGEVVEDRVVTATEVLDRRPRENVFRTNSHFRFQKVEDLLVDAEKGEVTPIWSAPISYYLMDTNLIREEDGLRRLIASHVTVFRVVAEAQGNFRVFVRIQRRNPANGEILTASGMIEINPKNR